MNEQDNRPIVIGADYLHSLVLRCQRICKEGSPQEIKWHDGRVFKNYPQHVFLVNSQFNLCAVKIVDVKEKDKISTYEEDAHYISVGE